MHNKMPVQKRYSQYLDGTEQVLRQSQKEKQPYTVDVLGRTFVIYPNVFSPKYFFDTEFFAQELPIHPGETFLEIGCGTGVTTVFAALRGSSHVTAIDINRDAVKNTQENVVRHGVENKVTVLHGDVYTPLSKDTQFDTIYWNTPFGYVNPDTDISVLQKAVYDPGYVSTKKFIMQAKNYLNPQGRLLIGFSSTLGKFDMLQQFLTEAGFSIVRLVSKTESVETYPVSFELFEAFRSK
ncbi:MAG: methyltransferase [Candidatus Magasanikbacteria bacterium]|nr:methyltransferase [Candidatus Magasanikbacteria bacterium]